MAKSKKDILRRNIEQSLLAQLALKGVNTIFFTDMIADYMKFWDSKNKLQQDIEKRGVTYKDVSSTGVMMEKNNPSTKELVTINRQMLCILKELGLCTDKVSEPDGEEL